MAYKAPIWEDGKSPAISAGNLNNLSQAAEGAQVLYGNSAPTSSTEGAVGQFYLVVVPDSYGNYPLYQCVAIANGSYVWRDTRRIPDSITSMLGIPAPGTINSALNVLANIGNVHVWERVQSGVTDYLTSTDRNAYPDHSEAGAHDAYYSLGDVVSGYLFASAWDGNASNYHYSEKIKVSDTGTLTQVNVKSYTANGTNNSWVSSIQSAIRGKFITVSGETNNGGSTGTNLVYIPDDAIVSYFENGVSLGYPYNYGFLVNKMQQVTGHAAIPPSTTITYLGQLGGGARIEVGSYVGTGTESADISVGFTPKAVIVSNHSYLGGTSDYSAFILPGLPNKTDYVTRAEIIEGGFRVYLYSNPQTSRNAVLNYSGWIYRYIAIG